MNTLINITLFFIAISFAEYFKIDMLIFTTSILFLMNCDIIRKIDKIHKGER